MKRLLPFFILLSLFLSAFVASDESTLLFKIERSKDANEILYTLNIDENGKLNEKPINAFWIKHTKKNKIEPLTWIQRKYAYGLKYLHSCKKCATFQFVSYDKTNLHLRKYKDEYKVFTQIKGDVVEVQKIFVQIDGGTFWVPNVTAVELHAKYIKSGEEVIETIQP